VRPISLERTLTWHEQLADTLPDQGAVYAPLLARARSELRGKGITFGGEREMAVALSALFLTESDVATLGEITGTLHGILEKVLGWVAESPARLAHYFADHRRIFPFLARTPGCAALQVISRYDAVVSPRGRLKIIELNTCCPAGFLHSEAFCQVTEEALAAANITLPMQPARYGTIPHSALVEGLLAMEDRSGLDKGLVGVLIDENQIMHELNLLVEEFRRQGRQTEVVDARELTFRDNRLWHKNKYLSLAYNKFRVSVPTSHNHYWKEGFEERYPALLAAMVSGSVVAANNFFGMSLGEDKSVLALLQAPEISALLTDSERQFVQEHVTWTVRLEDKPANWWGQTVDLLPFVQKNRDQLVIKPANEGRGFEVIIGRFCGEQEWQKAATPDPKTPRVVQEYVDAFQLPVIANGQEQIRVQPMYLTLGLACLGGEYCGVLSRISPTPVTNVAQKGMVQAVYVG
jgi:hypothetical protein